MDNRLINIFIHHNHTITFEPQLKTDLNAICFFPLPKEMYRYILLLIILNHINYPFLIMLDYKKIDARTNF